MQTSSTSELADFSRPAMRRRLASVRANRRFAPRHLPYWLSLAAALRTLGRHEAELNALERALALDPTHLVVLLQKGALLDLMHKPRSAATVYGHALQTLAPGTRLPEAIEAHVRHAEKRVRENAVTLAAAIDKRIGALRGAEGGTAQRRFERCLDRILGRRRVYFPNRHSCCSPT